MYSEFLHTSLQSNDLTDALMLSTIETIEEMIIRYIGLVEGIANSDFKTSKR